MRDENGHKGLIAAVVAWVMVVGAGMTVLWGHSLPGTAGVKAPGQSADSRVERQQ